MHREEYKSQTTIQRRGHVFRMKILLDIFNYWTQNGALTLSAKDVANRVKVCGVD
jgi:hypothetical protein